MANLRSIAIVAVLGGLMGMNFGEPLEVDDPFLNGPETQAQAAATIMAGRISHASKNVEKYSESGPNAFPLEWTFTGRLEHPAVLKGKPLAEPVMFSRKEESVFVPGNESKPAWEKSYGDLNANGEVVLFFGEGQPAPLMAVVPSGSGEQDLISLISEVIAIQQLGEPVAQSKRWLEYLKTAPSDEGKKAALRALVHSDMEWPQFAPTVTRLLENSFYGRDIRSFTFGIITYSLRRKRWHASTIAAVQRLCDAFADEKDPKLALQYLLSLKMLLQYLGADRDLGPSVRQDIMNSLAARQSKGLVEDPDLNEQYRQIRAQDAPYER